MLYARSVLAASALAASANAHIFIASPSPIPGSAPKDPLNSDGSNFPCHGVTLPGAGGQVMEVGSTQLLAFDTGNGANTAVHGGGSCQLSITYETDAEAVKLPSNWKVIYSIEGGCPTNSPLNLDGTYTGPYGTYTGSYQCNDTMTNGFDCVNQFNFTIPPGVMNGQATLAWNWFDATTYHEIYMNCVAIEITGGADDDSGMASMPEMFVANLDATFLGAAATCDTEEMTNVVFPNPGAYVTTKKPSSRNYVASATSQYPFAVPTGCPSDAGSTVSADADSSTTSSTSTKTSTSTKKTSSSSKTSTSTAVVINTTAGNSSTLATKKTTTSTKKSSTTSQKTSSTKKATTTSKKASGTSSTSSASASSTCAKGSVPCTTYDSIVCVDSSHFGICDYNNCAISQAVAAGTACKNGEITWA